jgi:hypothetical protein
LEALEEIDAPKSDCYEVLGEKGPNLGGVLEVDLELNLVTVELHHVPGEVSYI